MRGACRHFHGCRGVVAILKTLTVIVPCYNEEAVLEELFGRLQSLLDRLAERELSANVLLVDDGSRDRSHELMLAFRERDPRFGYLRLSRNFGHQPALSAGLDHAVSDAVAIIDGDLQDPPELIEDMAALWLADEAEVVYGVRKTREGALWKRICYDTFYRLFNLVVDFKVPQDAGDFCLMDRRVYEPLRAMAERIRYLRGLRYWIGFRQLPLEYHRPERFAGETKYGIFDLYRLATDGVASFSIWPMKILQTCCLLWIPVTLVYLLGSLVSGAWGGAFFGPFLGFSILLFVSGLYVAFAYLSRMFVEIKTRPLYMVWRHVPGDFVKEDVSGKHVS